MKTLKLVLTMLVMLLCSASYGSEPEKKDTESSGIREQVEITYMSQLHVRELTGKNDGKEVETFLASAGFGKGYAWCAAFVNWVYIQHDIPTPKTPAWSPSWFPSCKVIPNKQARKGDAMGIYFKSKKRIAHVGIIHKWPPEKDYCITVEGNTNRAGSSEGDGVYVKRRLKRQIYRVANWIDTKPLNC